jgi:RHS repeat-associated protein
MSRILSRFVAGLAPFLMLLVSAGGEAAYTATAPPHSAGTELTLPAAWRFEEPLIATASTSAKEDQALLAAIKSYRSQSGIDDFQALNGFLHDHPRSGWRVALLTNLGLTYFHYGYFSEAIDSWEGAWKEGKNVTELHARSLVDRALGELARMHSRLGHTERIAALLNEIGDRHVTGPATEAITGAREALWLMRHDPGVSFLCGPMALKNLLILQKAKAEDVHTVMEYRSSPQGVTLDQVSHLADQVSFPHRIIFRKPGQPIPVPSIVHWKVTHFAAIVGEANGRFHIQDPTFGTELWVTRSAIDHDSSGYFLVPDAAVRNVAWRSVGSNEAGQIRGMGVTYLNDALATLLNDLLCKSCNGTPGMATYNMHEMLVSLHISDTPLSYSPPKGPSVKILLVYNQREAQQPSSTNFPYFNISQKWSMNWLAFIVDDPTNPGGSVQRYAAGGGVVSYSGYNSATGAFTPETRDASVLVRDVGSSLTYTRQLQDGSSETYSLSDGKTSYPRRLFLTEITDPQGNKVVLNYDSQLRLTSLTDATGRQTKFSYGLSGAPLMITKITDPFGRDAQLTYDSSQRLIQITDAIGMKSQFAYDANSLIDSMTTPYGTTQFAYDGPGASPGNQRDLQVTDPLGYTEHLEYLQYAPGIPYFDPVIPQGMPDGLFDAYLYGRDTFYWDKHANVLAGTDFTMARNRHWAHTPDLTTTSHVLEAYKYPLENRVWMNYEGQSPYYYGSGVQGTFDSPVATGRVLDDGTTQLKLNSYNPQGRLTQTIDPVGRATQMTYAANGIDPVTVQQQTAASTYSNVAQFTYNNQHLPLTYTDAAGQTTSYTYNAAGQTTQTTDALSEVTTYQYDSLGYLTRIVNANGQTAASFTYDSFGRVATRTDSEGYTVNYAYDALDRVTTETYPDGTTRVFTWNKLDLTSVKDRQDRVTSYTYDAVRNLINVKDPLGHQTKFAYYENGTLKSLTDPNGNVTTWSIDIQSRVTGKTYADGSQVTNTYENTTSRLKAVTDALGQVKQNTYNLDNSLAAITYANAVHATPNVSYAYDPYFLRPVSMTDGSGTTQYTYEPVGSLGALQPLKEIGPFNNTTITYQYDSLGRVKARTVDTSTETFTYDSLGRPTSHGTPLGNFTLGYLGQTSQLTSQLLGNGVGTKWTYNTNLNDRRLKDIANSGATRSYQFTTTPENDITQIAETAPLGSAWAPQTWTYSYDESDRVQTGQSSSGSHYGYTYDPADNITAFNNPSGSEGATYNDLNQIKSFGSTAYIYDANGNVLDDGVRTYQWDAENRLIEVAHKTGPGITTFRYDGLGRRIAISYNGSETHYLWCGSMLCQGRTSTDTVTRRYYPEGEAIPLSGTLLYYGQDQLGSVRDVLAAQNGSRVASFDYDPYGNSSQSNGRVATDFRYAGMFYDQQDGLYLTQYRAYDSRTGRWVSRDPIEENGGLNLYAYVGGSPTNAIDPTGLFLDETGQYIVVTAATAARWSATAIATGAAELVAILSLSGDTPQAPDPKVYIFYHGTSAASAQALLGGAPLCPLTAGSGKIDGPPGFYLATDPDAAAYFALRRQGAILQYTLTQSAYDSLMSGGAQFGSIPPGGMAYFPGYQLLIPPSLFPTFNGLQGSGQIVVAPYAHE